MGKFKKNQTDKNKKGVAFSTPFLLSYCSLELGAFFTYPNLASKLKVA
jgi:hypothetical protein